MKISLTVLYSGWTERRMNGRIETSEEVIKEKKLKKIHHCLYTEVDAS